MTFLRDTFSAGADQELSLRTPEVGGSWVRHPSYTTTATILAAEGRLRGGSSSADSRYINNAAPPSADYEVRATCRVTSTSSNNRAGVLARYDASANTGYALWSDRSTWTLARFDAGTQTTLATFAQTLTSNVDYAVRLAVFGSTIEVIVDGVSILLVQDAAPITAAGRAGVFVRLDSRVDNVEALALTTQPALYAQEAVEVLMAPDPNPELAQVAVEALILQHVDAQLAQVAVEVMTKEGPSGPTLIAGDAAASLTGSAALQLGTPLAGTLPAALAGSALIGGGQNLAAAGRLEAHPRGRLAGAAAPATTNAGAFFLLF